MPRPISEAGEKLSSEIECNDANDNAQVLARLREGLGKVIEDRLDSQILDRISANVTPPRWYISHN